MADKYVNLSLGILDQGDGSIGNPWSCLTWLNTTWVDGDTHYVKGSYNHVGLLGTNHNQVVTVKAWDKITNGIPRFSDASNSWNLDNTSFEDIVLYLPLLVFKSLNRVFLRILNDIKATNNGISVDSTLLNINVPIGYPQLCNGITYTFDRSIIRHVTSSPAPIFNGTVTFLNDGVTNKTEFNTSNVGATLCFGGSMIGTVTNLGWVMPTIPAYDDPVLTNFNLFDGYGVGAEGSWAAEQPTPSQQSLGHLSLRILGTV
jgi:hypothetical protein